MLDVVGSQYLNGNMIELCSRDYPNVFYFVVIKTSVRAEMLELVKCWSPQRKKCIFFYVSHSHCGTTGDSVAGHGTAWHVSDTIQNTKQSPSSTFYI